MRVFPIDHFCYFNDFVYFDVYLVLGCLEGASRGMDCSLREEEILITVGAEKQHEIGLLFDGDGEIGGV